MTHRRLKLDYKPEGITTRLRMNFNPFSRIDKSSSQNKSPDLSRKEHLLATICMGCSKIHQTSHGLGL
jgi:hypothetical protein